LLVEESDLKKMFKKPEKRDRRQKPWKKNETYWVYNTD
jgi:hypothetical protein